MRFQWMSAEIWFGKLKVSFCRTKSKQLRHQARAKLISKRSSRKRWNGSPPSPEEKRSYGRGLTCLNAR